MRSIPLSAYREIKSCGETTFVYFSQQSHYGIACDPAKNILGFMISIGSKRSFVPRREVQKYYNKRDAPV